MNVTTHCPPQAKCGQLCQAKFPEVPWVASPPTSAFLSAQSKCSEGDSENTPLPPDRKLGPLSSVSLHWSTWNSQGGQVLWIQRLQEDLGVWWEKPLPGNLWEAIGGRWVWVKVSHCFLVEVWSWENRHRWPAALPGRGCGLRCTSKQARAVITKEDFNQLRNNCNLELGCWVTWL